MRPQSVRRWEATAATAAALPRQAPVISIAPLRGAAIRWSARLVGGVCAALVLLVVGLSIAPHVLPIQIFVVLSGSMQPTIPVGAVVVATPVAADQLRLGDVITFENPNHHDRLVTHRIRAISASAQGPMLQTQGDANPAPDAWVLQATKAPVYRYLFHVPGAGYAIAASQSLTVRVGVLVAAALAFAVLWWRSGDEA